MEAQKMAREKIKLTQTQLDRLKDLTLTLTG